MAIKTRAFSPIDMLHTDEEIAEWLTEAYKDEDPVVFMAVLAKVIKYRGVAQVAQQAGRSRESLYRTLNGKSMPKFDTVYKLLHALDVRLQAVA